MTVQESGDWRLDDLLKKASGGDQEAMAMVFGHYRPRLERMLRVRLDARHQGHFDMEDLLQEVYLAAAKRLAEFLQERKVPFYLWLRFLAFQKVIEVNRMMNAEKRGGGKLAAIPAGASGGSTTTDGPPILASETSPSGVALRHEMKEKLDEALGGLDPGDSEVIVLRYYEGLSNAEVAQVLEITENAASQRHFRALRRLRAVIEAEPELATYLQGLSSGPGH